MDTQQYTPDPPDAQPSEDPRRVRRRRRRRIILASTLAVTLAAGGSAAWAADRFLIPHVQVADVAAYEAANGGSAAASGSGSLNRLSYCLTSASQQFSASTQ